MKAVEEDCRVVVLGTRVGSLIPRQFLQNSNKI